ncbi:glycosyltransferase family 2 protein [uncultured Pontibacter sp.]|uniref:glycosyltransferase family 2 protein n=1 Tax=uncultured Pontibacter sp. TaxID=453356 RepID=UPI0026048DF9|nr:glycosyltransferase family 2 protein [uncultured Pontibacter sp.]
MAHRLQGGYRLNKKPVNECNDILISVITIVYNGDKYLEQTIQSVLNQTYNNVEYIIVDGGSTDNTLEIIRKYDSRIAYWISEPDKGISDAFNKGIALATGQLIGILNADDWYAPEAFTKIAAHYEPDSIIHGNNQYWNQDGSKAHQAAPNLELLTSEMSLNHPTVFVSKSLYQKYKTFDLRYKLAMDYHLLLRLYVSGSKFIYVDSVITNMRLGGLSANIVGCYYEVYRAKNEVLGKKLSHKIYLYWTLLRYKISSNLSRTPLSFINSLYRNYISPIKKQY